MVCVATVLFLSNLLPCFQSEFFYDLMAEDEIRLNVQGNLTSLRGGG